MSATTPQPDEFAERSAKISLTPGRRPAKAFRRAQARSDILAAPLTLLLTGFTSAAAVIGATAVFVKLFIR